MKHIRIVLGMLLLTINNFIVCAKAFVYDYNGLSGDSTDYHSSDTVRMDSVNNINLSKIKENKSDSIDVRNSVLLKKEYTFPYNNNFNIKYDPFKEKMKDSWVGDILKQIFFR
ncbi:hypothetical protein [Prevotella merdae]|jgi:hypothetical protein|uniref:hypothetical protein n=1 Tax=Prevotella TaxID=838 RepID=UPI000D0F110E|nr:hypothetical protein [Prevotella merdae]